MVVGSQVDSVEEDREGSHLDLVEEDIPGMVGSFDREDSHLAD